MTVLTYKQWLAVSVVMMALAGLSWSVFEPLQAESPYYEARKAFLAKKRQKKRESPKRYDKPKEAIEFFRRQRLPDGVREFPTEKYARSEERR